MAIRKKLRILMSRLGYVQREGKNEHFRYRFVAHADLMEKIQPLLVEIGILAIPRYEMEHTSEKGLVIVSCELELKDSEFEDEEGLVSRALGGGMDSGDKAPMKAMTAAHKYAWMHTLNLATGDDPEADPNTDKPKSLPQPAQAGRP
jgi:hypothetical protein